MRQHLANHEHQGMSIVYLTITMVVMCLFASFAVDLGRVQLAKTELQRAADAAARYGATGLATSKSQARTNAKAAAADNLADGAAVVLTNADIEFGRWDTSNHSFTVTNNTSQTNSVRVTATRKGARGTAVPLLFGGVMGPDTIDVTASATAHFVTAVQVDSPVNAAANPWLAGMPDGTLDNTNLYNSSVRRDRAGPYTDPGGTFHPTGESPSLLTGITLVPGQVLTFDAITGTGQHGPTQTIVGPDGDLTDITDAWAGAHFGKSNIFAPIDAVVAVFLDNSNPDGQTPPATLDFTTQTARDYTSLSPQLRQMFFIGDGRTSGGAVQQITVPTGATRLFIAKMDGTEWNNNLGVSTVTIHRPSQVTLVK